MSNKSIECHYDILYIPNNSENLPPELNSLQPPITAADSNVTSPLQTDPLIIPQLISGLILTIFELYHDNFYLKSAYEKVLLPLSGESPHLHEEVDSFYTKITSNLKYNPFSNNLRDVRSKYIKLILLKNYLFLLYLDIFNLIHLFVPFSEEECQAIRDLTLLPIDKESILYNHINKNLESSSITPVKVTHLLPKISAYSSTANLSKPQGTFVIFRFFLI